MLQEGIPLIADAAEKEGKFVEFLIALPEFHESIQATVPVRISLNQLSKDFSVNLTGEFVYAPGDKRKERLPAPVS
jgi:hypothetical protein